MASSARWSVRRRAPLEASTLSRLRPRPRLREPGRRHGDEQNHHPDVLLAGAGARQLWTHKIDGLTERTSCSGEVRRAVRAGRPEPARRRASRAASRERPHPPLPRAHGASASTARRAVPTPPARVRIDRWNCTPKTGATRARAPSPRRAATAVTRDAGAAFRARHEGVVAAGLDSRRQPLEEPPAEDAHARALPWRAPRSRARRRSARDRWSPEADAETPEPAREGGVSTRESANSAGAGPGESRRGPAPDGGSSSSGNPARSVFTLPRRGSSRERVHEGVLAVDEEEARPGPRPAARRPRAARDAVRTPPRLVAAERSRSAAA